MAIEPSKKKKVLVLTSNLSAVNLRYAKYTRRNVREQRIRIDNNAPRTSAR